MCVFFVADLAPSSTHFFSLCVHCTCNLFKFNSIQLNSSQTESRLAVAATNLKWSQKKRVKINTFAHTPKYNCISIAVSYNARHKDERKNYHTHTSHEYQKQHYAWENQNQNENSNTHRKTCLTCSTIRSMLIPYFILLYTPLMVRTLVYKRFSHCKDRSLRRKKKFVFFSGASNI